MRADNAAGFVFCLARMKSLSGPLLTELLKGVSRSFYWTLRVLPRSIRPPIGLAYLLARATDTIADTALVPVPQRLEALDQLRRRILAKRDQPLDFICLAAAQPAVPGGGTNAERVLLERVEEAVQGLQRFAVADQQRIREVLATITSGQELDLRRFGAATAQRIVPLATEAELTDYTYRVAGCVGEFWTKMCQAHLFPNVPLEDAFLNDGVRFGQGLQLVNILRDLPRDLRQGRCYLPADALTARGLTPGDLLEPGNEGRFRPVYDPYLDQAQSHLAAGWRYTLAVPRNQVRVRLACAWPILIGVKTLAALRQRNVLDAAQRIKVTRREVRAVLLRSFWALPSRQSWARLFDWAQNAR